MSFPPSSRTATSFSLWPRPEMAEGMSLKFTFNILGIDITSIYFYDFRIEFKVCLNIGQRPGVHVDFTSRVRVERHVVREQRRLRLENFRVRHAHFCLSLRTVGSQPMVTHSLASWSSYLCEVADGIEKHRSLQLPRPQQTSRVWKFLGKSETV